MTLAWLSVTLDAVEQYPLSLRGLQALFPNRSVPRDIVSWEPGDPREPNLPERLVIVRPVTRPATERWEQAVEQAPAKNVDGDWEQTWVVSDRVTVAEAKDQLRLQAVEVWWQKFVEPPTLTEVSDANLDAVTLLQARTTRLQTSLDDFRTQVAAASTLREVFDLFEVLEAAS